jgi:Rab3 GTPase-activating protein catalytic subunit
MDSLLTGFELIAIWSEKMVDSSLQMAELENDSPHEAEKWILFPIFSQNL